MIRQFSPPLKKRTQPFILPETLATRPQKGQSETNNSDLRMNEQKARALEMTGEFENDALQVLLGYLSQLCSLAFEISSKMAVEKFPRKEC